MGGWNFKYGDYRGSSWESDIWAKYLKGWENELVSTEKGGYRPYLKNILIEFSKV